MTLQTKKFQKKVEDFLCEHCGKPVEGSGYTNHCSSCLWSKHVDVHPGDRKATCRGLMKPTGVNLQDGEYVLTHTCQNCGEQKKNRVCTKDDFDQVVCLATEIAAKETQEPIIGSVTRAPLGAGQQSDENLLLGQPNLQSENSQ